MTATAPAEFDPATLAEMADRVARHQAQTLEYLRDRQQELAALPGRLADAQRLNAKLLAGGFPAARVRWGTEVEVEVGVKQLTALHAVVGRMRLAGTDVVSTKKRTAVVTLTAERHPGLTVKYYKKLKPGGRCRIVRTRSSHVSVSLTCEV